MTSKWSIALIIKDQLYGAGIANLVQGDKFDLTFVSESAHELAAHVTGAPVDLILFDCVQNEDAVATTVRDLKRKFAKCRIVVLAGEGDTRTLLDAFEAGADGAIHRSVSAGAFLESLSLVMAGEPVYPASLLNVLMQERSKVGHSNRYVREEPGPLARFSKRERDVMRLLGQGLSNKEIGAALGIAESSVKVHVRRICRTIGVKNRTQVALWNQKIQNESPERTVQVGEFGGSCHDVVSLQ